MAKVIKQTPLTIVFQVKDAETTISKAITSAKLLTNNIVVMDMQSQDQTAKTAEKAGAKLITIDSFEYVEPVRKYAFTKTSSEWVLILDADEQLTPELASEIKKIINSKTDITHFKIPRLNVFNNQPFKHGGWWPDSQIRLIKRNAFISWPENIHSTVKVKGKIGYLQNYFLHHFHGNLTQMVNKTLKFEGFESDLLYKANKKVGILTFFRKFFGELYRRLIKFQGWRDGAYGIIESIYQAYSKTITWLLLYEKYIKSQTK